MLPGNLRAGTKNDISNVGVSENSVPLNPMVNDPYPYEKWLFHWEYTLFSDKPMWFRDNDFSKCYIPMEISAAKERLVEREHYHSDSAGRKKNCSAELGAYHLGYMGEAVWLLRKYVQMVKNQWQNMSRIVGFKLPNGAFNPGSSRIKVTYSTTNSRSLHGKKGHSRKGHFEESG